MAIKRLKPEEIVTKSRQADVLVGQGMVRVDAIRQDCIRKNQPDISVLHLMNMTWFGNLRNNYPCLNMAIRDLPDHFKLELQAHRVALVYSGRF